MIRWLPLGLLAWLFWAVPATAASVPEKVICTPDTETVVLLHGMLRSARSMRSMQAGLEKAGYRVLNVDYPSRDYPVEELVPRVFGELQPPLNTQGCRIHFVTHSLGGILLRYYLAHQPAASLGRVVMLGPPNQGSEVVDRLGGLGLFSWINGPSGRQLGTGEESIPLQLGPVDFDLGVIAGNRSLNFLLSLLIPGSDDGKVSVERARVEGMQDFLVVPYTHIFMMTRPEVIRQTVHFLRQGHFDHTEAP